MKLRWTEDQQREAWKEYKKRGWKDYIWRVGIVRIGLPWAFIMAVLFSAASPWISGKDVSLGDYAYLVAVCVVFGALFGFSMAHSSWAQLLKRFG